jgi:hypothetical protein
MNEDSSFERDLGKVEGLGMELDFCGERVWIWTGRGKSVCH